MASLQAAGYKVVLGETCRGNAGYAAGPPQAVAADLHSLLVDDRVEAVIAASGGLSTMPVLRFVDWGLVRDCRKLLVGYSDVSVLLWATLAQAGLASLHGPMVISEWGETDGVDAETEAAFHAVVRHARPAGALVPPEAVTDERLHWDREDDRPRRRQSSDGWRCLREGVAEGPLLSGCLAPVSRLFGTPYLPSLEGAIVCLETINMRPEDAWSLLAQWEAAGALDVISGLVIGRHAQPIASDTGYRDFDDRILDILGDRPLPVLADVDFGHTDPMLALPVGVLGQLDSSRRMLAITTPAVSET